MSAAPVTAPVSPEMVRFLTEVERLAMLRGVRAEICIQVLWAMVTRRGVAALTTPEEIVRLAEAHQREAAARKLQRAVETPKPIARQTRGHDSANSIQDVENAAIEEARRPGATRKSVENIVWQRSVVGEHFPQKMQRGLVAGLAELKKQRLHGATVTHREVEVGGDPIEAPATKEQQ